MSIESNKALALRWHNEVLNQRKFHLIEEVIHPDYVNHDANIRGLAAAKEAFTQMMASGSTRVNTEDLIAEGDKVAVRWTNSEDDKITYKGITILRIADGKIIEDWFCAEEIKPV